MLLRSSNHTILATFKSNKHNKHTGIISHIVNQCFTTTFLENNGLFIGLSIQVFLFDPINHIMR